MFVVVVVVVVVVGINDVGHGGFERRWPFFLLCRRQSSLNEQCPQEYVGGLHGEHVNTVNSSQGAQMSHKVSSSKE